MEPALESRPRRTVLMVGSHGTPVCPTANLTLASYRDQGTELVQMFHQRSWWPGTGVSGHLCSSPSDLRGGGGRGDTDDGDHCGLHYQLHHFSHVSKRCNLYCIYFAWLDDESLSVAELISLPVVWLNFPEGISKVLCHFRELLTYGMFHQAQRRREINTNCRMVMDVYCNTVLM